MGCDIHTVAQVKKDGEWVTVMKKLGGNSRNYNTFTILAGVRSYGNNSKFYQGAIIDPQGFPQDFLIDEDYNHETKKGIRSGDDYSWLNSEDERFRSLQNQLNEDSVWLGEHSHHFYTAKQLNIYTKAVQSIRKYNVGYFTPGNIELILRKNFIPEEYNEEQSECNLCLSLEEYLNSKKNNNLPKEKFFIEYEWLDSPLDYTNIVQINKELQQLVQEYDVNEDEVRIVFGFDS